MSEDKLQRIREAAEADLLKFIKLVAPQRVLGSIHEELIEWWTRPSGKTNQLLLLPRAHQKSALIAYRTAWWITKNPHTTIMYVSATSNLAEKQLKAIKDVFTSKVYRRYWPEMTNPDEGKREKWTNSEIAVDHPKRKEEGVRDPTLWATGVGATQTGMHSDVVVYDDLVVPENAYTQEGRRLVAAKYSQMASVANPGSLKWVVGTRYHPMDIYKELQEMQVGVYKNGEYTGQREARYETFERQVEDQGDGHGEFTWPRQQRKDGTWFGFNAQVLDEIRNEYLDKSQFRAQYYNDPNDEENAPIQRGSWEHYDKKHLVQEGSNWYFRDKKLTVTAAVDFAFSRSKRADSTAIVTVGMDEDHNCFVLDIDLFKTKELTEYYNAILNCYNKWQMRSMRLETVAAQVAIVKDIKNRLKAEGCLLRIEEYHPTRHEGSKHERIQGILEPRYANGQMFHYRGGNCQVLEEELVSLRPPHDDCKDALAAAIDSLKPPARKRTRGRQVGSNVLTFNKRFGGVQR